MLIDDVEVQKIPLSELKQYEGDRHRGHPGYMIFTGFDGECVIDLLQ